MSRAVWNVCQQKIVAAKERPDSNDKKKVDPTEEASLAADEMSLLRLGGFA